MKKKEKKIEKKDYDKKKIKKRGKRKLIKMKKKVTNLIMNQLVIKYQEFK